ncbi:MAG TPA: alpha/beta hydrolase [Caulobacterales bacterium]|nr:alpha/beta hydrolase [Caulobacterales bacterium]
MNRRDFITVSAAATAFAGAQNASAQAPASTPPVIHLWEHGAPGVPANRRNEPEQAQDWWVRNIHNPSVTAFVPATEAATGAAIVIVPGGGHQNVVFPPEGIAPALFFQGLGVAAFALKYRLAHEASSPYTVEDAANDTRRAMRLVRSRAREWGIDPNRIGLMGWSAGGELAAMTTYGATDGDPHARDPIDRVSCLPDFQIVIYPGAAGVPERLQSPPPAFFLSAWDDVSPSDTILKLMGLYRQAGGQAEAHVFAQGSHAFNMGDRSQLRSIHSWPERLADWLSDTGVLAKR